MSHRIRFSNSATQHLAALSARDRAALLDAIEVHLTYQPTMVTRNRKRLRPNPVATWVLRVGHLRDTTKWNRGPSR